MGRSASSSSALLALLLLIMAIPLRGRAGDEFGEHYQHANTLYEQGHYEESLKELQAAYAIKQLPRLLLNMAQLHLKLGRPREALRFYQSYLDADPRPDAEIQQLIDQGTAEARARITAAEELQRPAPQAAPAPQALPAAALPQPTRQPEHHAHRPVYRRWWFWTAIGAAAAVSATAVALAVTQPWLPPDPPVIRNLEGKF